MMRVRVLEFLLLASVFLENFPVRSQCCHVVFCLNKDAAVRLPLPMLPSSKNCFCADGTKGTPCCGTKRCNIFCCNCSNGGCRAKGGNRRLREVDNNGQKGEPVSDEFRKYDINEDGDHDVQEAYAMVTSGACGSYNGTVHDFHSEVFVKFDKDGNNLLSYDEINERDTI